MNLQSFLAANQLPGEIYAGLILGKNGAQGYELFLRPEKPEKLLSWLGAAKWAESIGYELPTLQEQSLLFANCQPELEKGWHWSCDHSDSGDYAWMQSTYDGSQYYSDKRDKCLARAVRRVYLSEAA